jgi:hypothetical protein
VTRAKTPCLANITGLMLVMDPITAFRIRQVIAIVVAALVTAAAIRHFAHVNGGLAREEIRSWALTFAASLTGILLVGALFSIFFRGKRQK